MKTKQLSRKDREFLQRRLEILESGLKLFSEKGLHGVTMQDIAKESEFAVGTVYKFFNNKEDLCRALLIEKIDEMQKQVDKAIGSGKDELEALRSYLETLFREVKKNRDFFRIYLVEMKSDFRMDEELRARLEQTLNRLAEMFERGIQKKIFKDFDPHLLATFYQGILSAVFERFVFYADEHLPDAEIIMRIFFESVLLDPDLHGSSASSTKTGQSR